jgi:hypothetical protein
LGALLIEQGASRNVGYPLLFGRKLTDRNRREATIIWLKKSSG